MWTLIVLAGVAGIVVCQKQCTRFAEFPDPVTGKCRRDELGRTCLDPVGDSCRRGIVNGACTGGVCACVTGHRLAVSMRGDKYCAKITVGSACKPGMEGDSTCRLVLQDEQAMCEQHSCSCQCPPGKIFAQNRCEFRVYAAQEASCEACEKTGGACYDLNGDVTPDGCACPGKSFSSGVSVSDQLTFGCNGIDADIGESCTRGLALPNLSAATVPGAICRDVNAECVHSGVLSGRHVCRCRPGYTAVSMSPDAPPAHPQHPVCHRQLTTREDPTCARCTEKGGACYDVDEDFIMDGCVCPSTTSTTSDLLPNDYCNFDNVEVECNNRTMRVCLRGNDGPINIPPLFNDVVMEMDKGTAVAYIRGKHNESACHLEKQADGSYCIDLRTDLTQPGTFMDKCGALVVKPNKKQTSYMAWIDVQRSSNKMTMNDLCLHAYCTFDDIQCVSNGTLIKEPKFVAGTGEHLAPSIRMSMEDKFGELEDFQPVPVGGAVRLVVQYVDDLDGTYTHLRPEICIISNLPHLDIPGVKTILFIDHGVLVDNEYMSLGSNFKPDLQNSRTSRTGFFRMCMFEDSEFVFFHCAVRVCRSAEPCQPLLSARRRRSVAMEGPIDLPETLDELEASEDYQRVTFGKTTGHSGDAAVADAKERMENPFLANADLAIKVVKNEDYYAELEEEAARGFLAAEVLEARENRVRGGMDREHVTINRVSEPPLHFSTVLTVVIVGTAALTFGLAVASFYLVTAAKRAPAKTVDAE